MVVVLVSMVHSDLSSWGIAGEDLYLQRPIGCPYDLYRRDTGNREKYNIQYHGYRNPERNVYKVEESFYRSRVACERCTF